MFTANMDDFRNKQDEMLRQAEKYRLIQTAQKPHSPAVTLIKTLRIVISSLFTS